MARIERARRNQMASIATEVRHRGLGQGMTVDAIAERICEEVEGLLPLEAHRLARGWSRTEVSSRIDALYRQDGLAPPKISSAELCRWEHGHRRPNDERIEFLCRLYETRPDRLGFGIDFSTVDVGHLTHSGLTDLWPRTTPETFDDLTRRIQHATEDITVFGLTRNFYARDAILPLFESKARRIPVTFYVMDPWCDSRRDRYRIEPGEAAMEDPYRYAREILRPLQLAAERVEPEVAGAGMRIYTYNFPCSFAMEKTDQTCRVMTYGHGKRGTDGPIFVFGEGTAFWDYYVEQLEWLGRLATEPREPWISKGIEVRPLVDALLAGGISL